MLLCMAKETADVIKLRILRLGTSLDYPGDHEVVRRVLTKEKQEGWSQRAGSLMRDAGWIFRSGHTAGILAEVTETRIQILLQSLQRNQP